ncbi:MAG: GTPase HflX [Peptococcaceae bacterium]|nr:GTPase HflX [Peptococcaceae bacterium]MBO5429049.1 GTPase HflX [Peptococcaceae bacterium]
MHEMEERRERAILVFTPEQNETWQEEELYEELKELSNTAGLDVVDYLVQHRNAPDAAYCIGKGKLEELSALCAARDADCVIFDHPLSPSQLHNLTTALDAKVLDKTMLILDIFAQRARSREGKLQVELAQASYLLPRLLGQGVNLSRQGGGSKSGGVGTRGPGETKLETDRRRIRQRIQMIQQELEEVRKHREVQQKNKLRNNLPLVALVGYTNAGKSSLLNRLTDDNIYVQDQLFATLDPTTRAFYLPNGTKALLTDTVGFIRDLPSQLITAFKATLDELQYADLLLHVIDISNPNFENQLEAVEAILQQLNLQEKPRIYVFNKIDCLETLPPVSNHLERESCCYISAASGENLTGLLALMEQKLVQNITCKVVLPMDKAGLINQAYASGQVTELEYTETSVQFIWYGRQESLPNSLQQYVESK